MQALNYRVTQKMVLLTPCEAAAITSHNETLKVIRSNDLEFYGIETTEKDFSISSTPSLCSGRTSIDHQQRTKTT